MKCSCILIRLRHNPVFSRRTVNSVLVSLSTSGTCTHVPSSDYAKFCSQIGYINSSNRITHHQEMGRGCSHVNVLKFFRLSKCSASRGFVSLSVCLPHLLSSPPSPSVAHGSSSPPPSPPSPLSVTTSVFHSELKTWLFGKSFPP